LIPPKLIVFAEGATEESFVARILAPHLESLGIFCRVTVVSTKHVKSGPDFKGGMVSYEKVKKELLKLLADSSASAVTTMFDKPVNGVTIAQRIGLPTMRRACPHFGEWIAKLEGLKPQPLSPAPSTAPTT
jgi:hypothetical protein